MKLFGEEKKFHSHMPYIFEGKYLIFCQATLEDRILEADGNSPLTAHLERKTPYQAYRPKYCEIDLDTGETGEIKEIDPDCWIRQITCNPHVYRDLEGTVHFMFVRTVTTHGGKLTYKLFRKSGSSIDNLGDAEFVRETFLLRPYTGFENNKYRVIGNNKIGHPYFLVGDFENKEIHKYNIGGIQWLRRIIPNPQNEDEFIITFPFGRVENGNYNKNRTILYNHVEGTTREVVVEGSNVYKSCIWDDKIVHAVQTTDENGYSMDLHFDTCEIKHCQNVRIIKGGNSKHQTRFR